MKTRQAVQFLLAGVAVMLHTCSWAFSVAFISPGRHDEAYWLSATRAMQAAATSLDIQLEVLYAERNPLRMVQLARDIGQRGRKPDFLMVVNEKQAAPAMLQLADKAGIPVFISFNDLTANQLAETGPPRTRYKLWLGSLAADNERAGELTMQALLNEAQRRFPGASKHLLMMAGDSSTPASTDRIRGARKALAKAGDQVELTQLVYGEWEKQRAFEQGQWLLRRYPEINLIWTANDEMAFGLEDALKRNGKDAGKQVLISSINNSPSAMQQRRDGKFAALAAGHFMVGAWSLVMLYDYRHGKDFAGEGLRQNAPAFSLISPDMAQRYLQRFAAGDFSGIDFKHFSKAANPALNRYSFAFGPLLNQESTWLSAR
ncbi:ABC transporter substrate-binding protein [uncultured Aquitalea sp.]|uniref:ABC transporter substrate-binding protein n=1 Tax=uncultured Aquitalea sp. TaxID=540272 RepID=UPI0025DD8ADD|nr:ABC transporter substrate-binding protein [uncultured Aquitalea sp.]